MAQEGTHVLILTGNNPISQTVNSSTMTITNATLPGHIFDPGTVGFQVDPAPGDTSVITITGTGTGDYPVLNDIVGELFFGGVASGIALSCSYSPI
jgi:hypothetical protein